MKKGLKGALIGGTVGFLIPVIIFLLTIISCKSSECSDFGIAIPLFILFSIISLIIGFLIGLTYPKKIFFILNLVFLLIIVIYIITQFSLYYSTPLNLRGESPSKLILPLIIIELSISILLFLISLAFKKKNKILLIFISLILLTAILTIPVNAYVYNYTSINNKEINSDNNSNMTIQPMFAEVIGREFIVDAPWRINTGEKIPMLVMIRDTDNNPYSFYSLKIYDNYNSNSPKLVKTLSFSNLGLSKDGNCWGSDYATLDQHLWYYEFTLDPTLFVKDTNNKIYINAQTDGSSCGGDGDWNHADNGNLIISIDSKTIPKLNDWYCGDTHYHSIYTDTYFWLVPPEGEFGAPLDATFKTLNSMGLDWLTPTDHSNSFENGQSTTCISNRNTFKNDCNSYSNCLIGEEINCDYGLFGTNGRHFLGYDMNNLILDNSNNCFPNSNDPTCSQIINLVSQQNGFGYVAHPMSSGFFGFAWDLWQNYSLPFSGLEIWNQDISESGNIDRINSGVDKWKQILLSGKKIFISAGTDAHGDFNTAFGKEYTCVYAPTFTKSNLYNSFKNGNSYISNNGALVFSINNRIIGQGTGIIKGNQVKLDINYNIDNGCYIKIFRGRIGDSGENQVGSQQWISSGSTGSYSIFDSPISNSYYRLECISSDGNKRIYTNPIWVDVNQSSSEINFATKIITSSCGGMCIRYNYTINLPPSLLSGIKYDSSFVQTSNHIKLLDADNKAIEMLTYDTCLDPGNIVPTCSSENRLSSVLYNGQVISLNHCTITNADTTICWQNASTVTLSRSEISCTPNWILASTSSCQSNNIYTDWIDTNNCNDNASKPVPLNKTCLQNETCQNGACKNIACFNDSQCDDNNPYTQDNCVNSGTPNSFCDPINIMCLTVNDSRCNDNNPCTPDVCINPGKTNSYCYLGTSPCCHDLECGNNRLIGNNFCSQNNSILGNYLSYKCNSPGTLNAYCSNSTSILTLQTCSSNQICTNGSCCTLTCSKDVDCNDANYHTIDQCIYSGCNSYCKYTNITCLNDSDPACNDNNAGTEDHCINPGTLNSSCLHLIAGDCDCNDNNPYTEDKCMNSGTINAICIHLNIMCLNDSDPACNDNNAGTEDHCINPGTIQSYCNYTTLTEVKCFNNSMCGNDVYIGNNFCLGNNVTKNRIYFTCHDAGTDMSYCTNITVPEMINACPIGTCGPTYNYCKGNSVYKNQTCFNNGCSEGGCFNNSFINETLVQNCLSNQMCQNGVCITTEFLSLINPTQGIYNERSVKFDLSSTSKFVKLVYSDNNGRESTLCTNCYGYARPKTLNDGNHTLLFKGILTNGNFLTNQTKLFIDSKDPQISFVKPQSRRYTNGSDFYIKYTEDNCQTLKILINGQEISSNLCQSGKNIERFIPQNLNSFNGLEVEYQFMITDIAKNLDLSKKTKIFVDITPPVINNPTSFWNQNGKYVNFNISITELNLDSVKYSDSFDGARARWNTLCSRLSKNNRCIAKKSFKIGLHNLAIQIVDKAGNSVQKNINFTI